MRILTAVLIALISTTAWAGEKLMIKDAWIATAPPGVHAHAGYLEIHNHGDTPRTLIEVKVDGYDHAMLHESRVQDGVVSMHNLEKVVIPVGGAVLFKPHGKHLMLMGTPGTRTPGDASALTLVFADGTELSTELVVRDHSAMAKPKSHDHSAHIHQSDRHTSHAHGQTKHAEGHKTE